MNADHSGTKMLPCMNDVLRWKFHFKSCICWYILWNGQCKQVPHTTSLLELFIPQLWLQCKFSNHIIITFTHNNSGYKSKKKQNTKQQLITKFCWNRHVSQFVRLRTGRNFSRHSWKHQGKPLIGNMCKDVNKNLSQFWICL